MNILKPGDIAFDPSVIPTADSIDSIPSRSQDATPATELMLDERSMERMQKLGENTWYGLAESGTSCSLYGDQLCIANVRTHTITPLEQALIPYMVTLHAYYPQPLYPFGAAVIHIGAISGPVLRDALMTHYDPDIAATGVFEKCNISKEEFNDFKTLERYLGIDLSRFADRVIFFRRNPYQTILSVPVVDRPFLVGATDEAIVRDPSLGHHNDEISPLPLYPITFKDVFAFGKRTRLIEGASDRFDRYLKIAEKNRSDG